MPATDTHLSQLGEKQCQVFFYEAVWYGDPSWPNVSEDLLNV